MSMFPNMTQAVSAFIAYRQQLGYDGNKEAGYLRRFAIFADNHALGEPLTSALILRWANSGNARPTLRLAAFRHFVPWLVLRDPRVTVPNDIFHGSRYPRGMPYIYSPEEVSALLAAVRRERYKGSAFQNHSHVALLGLLIATGMRVGEVLRLDRGDVNFETGDLSVRASKNLPLRLVPLHMTTLAALRVYADLRDNIFPHILDNAFILSSRGRRIQYSALYSSFTRLMEKAGVPFRSGAKRPRLRDFRHTFAYRHLLHQYRAGRDIHVAIADLSTYMGHRYLADTYWYLTSLPELSALCGEKFRRMIRNR